MIYLHLVEGAFNHLYRIFNRTDIHLGGCQLAQGRIERGCLTRTGWAGDQYNAVAAVCHRPPVFEVRICQAQFTEAFLQDVGVKNTHDQFFTKGRGQCGQAQLHFTAIWGARF